MHFDISGNNIRVEGTQALAAALKGNMTMTRLNMSSNNMTYDVQGKAGKMAGIIALSGAIKDMRAILSVNLLKNGMGVEQARALVIILKEHPTLKSLCGNNGDETELDMSGKMEGAEDAIMLAAEVVDNGAMTSLDLASNSLGIEGAKIIADILPKCT